MAEDLTGPFLPAAKKRSDKTTPVVSDSSPFSTVAHLHLDAVSLSREPKPDVPEGESWVEKQARLRREVEVGVPPLLDEDSTEWEEAAQEAHEAVTPLGASDAKQPRPEAAADAKAASDPLGPQARRTGGGWLYVSEMLAPRAARQGEIEDEVRACFDELEGSSPCLATACAQSQADPCRTSAVQLSSPKTTPPYSISPI